MQINKILLIGMFCALFFTSSAQIKATKQLWGYLKSVEGKSLNGVTVSVEDLSTGYSKNTISDHNGIYKIADLPSGRYILKFLLVGYQELQDTIFLEEQQSVQQRNFVLYPQHTVLQSVSVEGKSKSQNLRESQFSVNVIDVKPLANTTADINQVLNRSSGVRVRESGGMGSDFNFSLQGLSGKQVRFFMDGIPMETFGKAMNLNNIPINIVQRIEVYKGVVPVELGTDALAGAVNIVSNHTMQNYLDVGYSRGSFHTHQAYINSRITGARTGLYLNLNGFFNYSDNDYLMKGIQIVEDGSYVTKDARRFHDAYRSVMGQAEVGLVDKKWADLIAIGILRSDLYSEQQTGATQEVVFGQLTNSGKYLMPTLKYRKNDLFIKGLSANLFATYAKDISNIVDTTSNRYDWSGKVWRVTPGKSERGGSTFALDELKNRFFMGRANFGYSLNSNHAFNVNYTFNSSHREQINQLFEKVDDNPARLDKHVGGVAWQSNWFNQHLETSLFAKFFGFRSVQNRTIASTGGFETNRVDDFNGYWGYGLAGRYKVSHGAGVKMSYEHSYRLQELMEMFGDGITIISNVNLKPESSHNLNLGGYFTKHVEDHHFTTELAGYHREAKDFIINRPNGGVSQYLNVPGVRITGFETEVRYNYKNFITASATGTYQKSINKNQYVNGKDGMIDITYKNRIPNQPWFFGNIQWGIGKDNLFGRDTRIQLNWTSEYVHWFYLTWSALGDKNGKDIIPTQFVHHAYLSYSLKNGRYNVGLQLNNLTDNLVFDNFRLQKPGRGFMLKVRYYISSQNK